MRLEYHNQYFNAKSWEDYNTAFQRILGVFTSQPEDDIIERELTSLPTQLRTFIL